MNWLAHLVLSERSPTFRIGNLLPDLMTWQELLEVPQGFRDGIECHRRIDAFTDRHRVVRRSLQRIVPPYRRFAPILVDIFYDHFLSVNWSNHCPQPLNEFIGEVYASFETQGKLLPQPTRAVLEQMRAENWLGSYREIAGVQLTLERVARRLQRTVTLGDAIYELEENYEAIRRDFDEFFPELLRHVKMNGVNPDMLSSTPTDR